MVRLENGSPKGNMSFSLWRIEALRRQSFAGIPSIFTWILNRCRVFKSIHPIQFGLWMRKMKELCDLIRWIVMKCDFVSYNIWRNDRSWCVRAWNCVKFDINSANRFLQVSDYFEQFAFRMLYCRIVGYAPVTIKKYTVCCWFIKFFFRFKSR